ncbi:hypothetical protein PFICI_03578 [Pestalotiopsis fici W106-1]|uniref:Uncharacterized protein n=1 Tax=Pestalotiopsis fici (strain W106-1 / CGMCC3.15140) TaxID=1229662 RepID=W3XHJ7_PESFW|nr:uncharacterized protein PFICI_03578 [Pestalotiopsis fici W106-1]ETS85553.1 hypothetical protein PFICI_03578 [Pestalotiopsis fici W106-1]
MSATLGRSYNGSAENPRINTTGPSVHEVQGEGNRYVELSDFPLAAGKTIDSRGPNYRSSGNMSPYIAGSINERAEKHKH